MFWTGKLTESSLGEARYISRTDYTQRRTIVDPAADWDPTGSEENALERYIDLLRDDIEWIQAHRPVLGMSIQEYFLQYYTGLVAMIQARSKEGFPAVMDMCFTIGNQGLKAGWDLDYTHIWIRIGDYKLQIPFLDT